MSSADFDRAAVLRRIVDVLERDLSAHTLRFHATVAACLGINMTDYKALELVYRQPDLMASAVADYLGLTAGAVTGSIDRLERAGLVQRSKTGTDRRQVRVRPVAERQAEVMGYFTPLGDAMHALTERYTDADLAIIDSYLTHSVQVVAQAIRRLQAADDRRQAADVPDPPMSAPAAQAPHP